MNTQKAKQEDKNTSPINQEEIQYYLKELRRIKVMTHERERELSAEAIANKINDASSESGSSGKGLLGGALAVLGSVISGGLDLLYKGLKTALFSVMGGIMSVS